MAEIVNLRRHRRQRQRDAAARDAADSRARHGRTRAERVLADDERSRREAALDGARIEPRGPEEPPAGDG